MISFFRLQSPKYKVEIKLKYLNVEFCHHLLNSTLAKSRVASLKIMSATCPIKMWLRFASGDDGFWCFNGKETSGRRCCCRLRTRHGFSGEKTISLINSSRNVFLMFSYFLFCMYVLLISMSFFVICSRFHT